MTFQRLNTRAAKIHGEGIMEIRRRYAAMESYPAIRQALIRMYGITLSEQQIARIAKGRSFPEIGGPVLPTDREVDLTMHLNALKGAPPASESEVAASLDRLHALMAREDEPQESIMEILERRTREREQDTMTQQEALPLQRTMRKVPTLEEVEARERAVMGVEEGSGLDKLLSTQVDGDNKTVAKVDADKLLETLKDEHPATSND
jgi:hypothetical protein